MSYPVKTWRLYDAWVRWGHSFTRRPMGAYPNDQDALEDARALFGDDLVHVFPAGGSDRMEEAA